MRGYSVGETHISIQPVMLSIMTARKRNFITYTSIGRLMTKHSTTTTVVDSRYSRAISLPL